MSQVDHFVHEDVLQALRGLLGQVEVEPDSLRFSDAAPPAALPLLDADLADADAYAWFPDRQKRRNLFSEAVSVPVEEDGFALGSVAVGANAEVHLHVVGEAHLGRTV